jgi:Na+-transporting NADH:ubiquinone oxidoreductase subunit A
MTTVLAPDAPIRLQFHAGTPSECFSSGVSSQPDESNHYNSRIRAMHIRIKKGLTLPINGAPRQTIENGPQVGRVALIGQDYVGMKPTMLVAEGDTVKLGQPLFEDKKNPGVIFTSPGSGVVEAINRGAKRALQSVVIRLEGDEAEKFEHFDEAELESLDASIVRENLLKSGLWTSLRTRPYSKIPAPQSEASAIFVNAMDSNPLAADPSVVIAADKASFETGLRVLNTLNNRLFVCTAPDANISLPTLPGLTHAEFSGPHPAGLVGTHIHHLHPASASRIVWHIDYQDVMAIGRLFSTGRLPTERVIALSGPQIKDPRLLRTRTGAHTDEIIQDQMNVCQECRVISGSVLAGRRAGGWASYLGRYHLQLTVLAEGGEREFLGWIRPGPDKFSTSNVFVSALKRASKYFDFSTSQNGSPRAMVPIGNYEDIMPLDILPTQLLRALVVKDTDAAQELGCLELDEGDLALCSFVCVGKYNFGPYLRANLEQIEREG